MAALTSPEGPLRVAVVFGTRPEAIKLVPVIQQLQKDERFSVRTVVTGQHREMLDDVLVPFGVRPTADLDIMHAGQTLNDIVSRALPRLDQFYRDHPVDFVIAQGDTTSAFCAALTAFHRRLPVGHVEAGLRSFDRGHPYPEECNRRMIAVLADLHFAPTRRAAANLRREGMDGSRIVVTGNTIVDALRMTLRGEHLTGRGEVGMPVEWHSTQRVLITLHRRETWTEPGRDGQTVLDCILGAIERVAERHPDVEFVYPVHKNPRVRAAAERAFGVATNVRLMDPLPYLPFVKLMASASVIVTDSGGVQEEAPYLGVPALVVRKATERTEALIEGSNRLLGTDPSDIERGLTDLLTAGHGPQSARDGGAPHRSPFGDGKASDRILEAIMHFFGRASRPVEYEES